MQTIHKLEKDMPSSMVAVSIETQGGISGAGQPASPALAAKFTQPCTKCEWQPLLAVAAGCLFGLSPPLAIPPPPAPDPLLHSREPFSSPEAALAFANCLTWA